VKTRRGWGLRFKVSGFRFRVSGFGFRDSSFLVRYSEINWFRTSGKMLIVNLLFVKICGIPFVVICGRKTQSTISRKFKVNEHKYNKGLRNLLIS
jgi:hypothetical protein